DSKDERQIGVPRIREVVVGILHVVLNILPELRKRNSPDLVIVNALHESEEKGTAKRKEKYLQPFSMDQQRCSDTRKENDRLEPHAHGYPAEYASEEKCRESFFLSVIFDQEPAGDDQERHTNEFNEVADAQEGHEPIDSKEKP